MHQHQLENLHQHQLERLFQCQLDGLHQQQLELERNSKNKGVEESMGNKDGKASEGGVFNKAAGYVAGLFRKNDEL